MKKLFFLLTIVSFTFISCKKDKNTPPPVVPDTCDYKTAGLQKDDPYALSVMQKLAAKNGLKAPLASHKYVKVKIANADEYQRLMQLGEFFPFDISKEPSADLQHPIESDEKGLWMYGLVPVNASLNFSETLNLYDVYIPDEKSEMYQLLNPSVATAKTTATTIQGAVKYYDPIAKELKGIKGIKISIIDGTRNYGTITGDDGSFAIDKSIISEEAEVLLKFDNTYMEIRTLDFDNLLGILAPNTLSVGMKKACAFANLNIEIGSETKNATLQHTVAALHVYNQFSDFAKAQGYGLPTKKVNLWVAKDAAINGSYAAPMLRNVNVRFEARDLLANLFGIPPSLANTLANAIKNDLPDIYAPFYTTNPNRTPIGYLEALFHEFSHATHFTKAGPAYWSRYIEHIYGTGGYGEGNDAESGLVALSEAFAEDLSLEALAFTYGNEIYNASLRDANTSPAYPWIPWGIYYDMNDIADNESFDQIGGFSFRQLYDLFGPDVDNPEKFKSKLFLQYAVSADNQNKTETLFEHYGF